MDRDLQELLHDKAEEMQVAPEIPSQVLRRARRRRLRTGALAGAAVATVAMVAFIGIRAATKQHALVPVNSPTPSPSPAPSLSAWRGVWPAVSWEEGQNFQRQADEGSQPWLLDAQEFITRYAQQELGWAEIYFDPNLVLANGLDLGPLKVHVYSCDPTGCQDTDPRQAMVTIERLIRRETTGAWFVTRIRGPNPFRAALSPFTPGDTSGLPETYIALQRMEGGEPIGSLVVVDTATAEVVRSILDNIDLSEGGPGPLVLSSDGTTLYFGQATSACTDEIRRVPVAGGAVEVVVKDGRLPALSPDGALLAYVTGALDFCGGGEQSLVVRTLATGEETTWALGDPVGAGFSGVCRMAWLPDSQRIAFNLCSEEGDDLFLLDVSQEQGIQLKDARRLGASGRSYRLLGYHAGSSGLAAIEGCATPDCTGPPMVVAIDPETGVVTDTLFDPTPALIYSAAFDATGSALIYSVVGGEVARVFGWDGAGEPVEVGRGYLQVTW